MSSYASVGSHSISVSLGKRPFEQVNSLNAVNKTHSSMGFRETAALKQVQQRTSGATGGFLSQRTASIDQGTKGMNNNRALDRSGDQSRSFQIKKTVSNHRRIFERTMTQSRTKKPKQQGLAAQIVSIKAMPGSALSTINLGKKQCSSQQSGVLNSFLRNRQQKQASTNILSQTTRHSRSINAVPSSQQSGGNQRSVLGLTGTEGPTGAGSKQAGLKRPELSRQESAKLSDLDLLGLLPLAELAEPAQDH